MEKIKVVNIGSKNELMLRKDPNALSAMFFSFSVLLLRSTAYTVSSTQLNPSGSNVYRSSLSWWLLLT